MPRGGSTVSATFNDNVNNYKTTSGNNGEIHGEKVSATSYNGTREAIFRVPETQRKECVTELHAARVFTTKNPNARP